MPYDLSLHPLCFTAEAIEPLELDEHAGSSLRGALFNALLRRFCMNPTAPTCADCPLNATCPVAELVAPLRDEHPRGRDIPRPFVIEPPMPDACAGAEVSLTALASTTTQEPARGAMRARTGSLSTGSRLAPGQPFTFGITLIGTAARLLPYVVMAAQMMGAAGMGRPLRANGGRRGRFALQRVALTDPFGDVEQVLYRRGDQRVAAPALAITPATVAARTAGLPADHLTVHFLTPTRLIANGQLVRRPDLGVVVARLAERLDALSRQYGATDERKADDTWNAPGERERAKELAKQAASAQIISDETRWVDVASYSARQQRATPIGGFVGAATFASPDAGLSPELRELLVWGELLHVGKNAVKGDGRYRLEI